MYVVRGHFHDLAGCDYLINDEARIVVPSRFAPRREVVKTEREALQTLALRPPHHLRRYVQRLR